MKNIFKKTSPYATTIAILCSLFVASSVFAWTAPTGPAPVGNVVAPVNTGTVPQTKKSDFSIIGTLKATIDGRFGAGIFSPIGFFGPDALGITTSTNILTAMRDLSTAVPKGFAIDQSGAATFLNKMATIDLRGNSGSAGRNALDIQASLDNDHAVFTTNRPGFHFWSNATSKSASILAGAITLRNGCLLDNPPGSDCTGKILASDSDGNASWNSLNATGGGIDVKYLTGTCNISSQVVSPAAAGTTCGIVNSGNTTKFIEADVPCPSGYVATGGGFLCSDAGVVPFSQPIVNFTNGVGTPVGWKSRCERTSPGTGSFVITNVICMKYTAPTIAVATPPTGPLNVGTPPNPTPTPTWHTITGSGLRGQSCQGWVSGLGLGSTTVRALDQVSGTTYPGECAYIGSLGTGNVCIKGSATSAVGTAQPVASCSGATGNLATQVYY
jgi:hypothetical protein